jgi:hypothetical protein
MRKRGMPHLTEPTLCAWPGHEQDQWRPSPVVTSPGETLTGHLLKTQW